MSQKSEGKEWIGFDEWRAMRMRQSNRSKIEIFSKKSWSDNDTKPLNSKQYAVRLNNIDCREIEETCGASEHDDYYGTTD